MVYGFGGLTRSSWIFFRRSVELASFRVMVISSSSDSGDGVLGMQPIIWSTPREALERWIDDRLLITYVWTGTVC